jgi:hypothetical protein
MPTCEPLDTFDMSHLSHVQLSAQAGTSLVPALREAAIFALSKQCLVLLTFNEKDYRIDPSAILNFVDESSGVKP